MSDIHILTITKDQKTANCIFHISIPSGNNAAGITWQAAIVREQGGADAITSLLYDISAEELSALKDGSLYEKLKNVRFSSTNLNNGERLNEIKAAYAVEETELIDEKQITLKWMGYEGDV